MLSLRVCSRSNSICNRRKPRLGWYSNISPMSEISKSKEPCVTVPPVHGRPNTIPTKTRIGYHQRNLSLDFRLNIKSFMIRVVRLCWPFNENFLACRSMGILLPPISQVTNTTKVSSHHRNRSLDSVLQRIPEVDVTPSPECETPSSDVTSFENNTKASANRDDYGSLGSDDSGIACRFVFNEELQRRSTRKCLSMISYFKGPKPLAVVQAIDVVTKAWEANLTLPFVNWKSEMISIRRLIRVSCWDYSIAHYLTCQWQSHTYSIPKNLKFKII